MLIRLLRSSMPVQWIVFILLSIALFAEVFLFPIEAHLSVVVSPFVSIPFAEMQTPGYRLIVAFLYVLIAFLLQQILFLAKLTDRFSLMAANMMLLLVALNPMCLVFTPVIGILLLLMGVLYYIFKIYDSGSNQNYIINSSFILALGAIIFTPATLLLLYLLICMMILNVNRWRQWLMALISFLFPFLYLVVYFFITDQVPERMLDVENFVRNIVFTPDILPTHLYITTILLCVCVIYAIIHLFSESNAQNIIVRKHQNVTMLLLLFMGGITIIDNQPFLSDLSLCFVPAASILGIYFSRSRYHFWLDVFVTLTLLAWGCSCIISCSLC